MHKKSLSSGLLLTALLLSPGAVAGQNQDAEAATGARVASLPNVFFDCNGPACDQNYYRTEIAWVNWVRDPGNSDVHVIITSQTTGSGGREFLLDFSGGDRFSSYTDKLSVSTLPSDTERERLDAMVHTLSVGLARFAATNGYRNIVRLSGTETPQGAGGRGRGAGAGPGGVVSAEQVNDPWNLWTFRIGGNANLNGQESRSTTMVNANVNASRITPAWRVTYGANVNYNRQRNELSSGTNIDKRVNYGINTLMVNALAGHWSGGFSVNVQRMEMQNQRIQVAIQPALEYSYFPYEEATRRSLTLLYEVGPQYRNYLEETIYQKLEETQVEQSLGLEFSQRQTWGDAGISVNASQFLGDLGKYRVGVNGNLSFRIFRGLNLNLNGNYSRQTNQIYESARGVTDVEILLNRRSQASAYNYGMNIGLNYQFGSIFNNVVNNRFSGAGPGPGGRGGGPGGFGGGPGRGGGE